MQCLGCGVEKDPAQKELYPYVADGLDCGAPISPLLAIDCQGPRIPNDPNRYSEFRAVLVCHSCFHKLEPDMWVTAEGWLKLNPLFPYEKLPRHPPGTKEAFP
jgi:hypothetical protein